MTIRSMLKERLTRLTSSRKLSRPAHGSSDAALVVGLGNPGPQYAHTRHNMGRVVVEDLAGRFAVDLRMSRRFQGRFGRGEALGRGVFLLLPETYMNRSGSSVVKVLNYFQIPLDRVLVVHDEVAYEPGKSRLKFGGGTNGHKGLIDTIRSLGGQREFARLRIGVGHPGAREEVVPFLTRTSMPPEERERAIESANLSDELVELILAGKWCQAMNVFNAGPVEHRTEPDKSSG